ncbi:hypothetical protein [Bacillus sp. Bos-x628]|uniref:hypothetical protein n=1 Tax=Bacillus maqinnsis TaxID=3229854 RepID=UPI00338E4206
MPYFIILDLTNTKNQSEKRALDGVGFLLSHETGSESDYAFSFLFVVVNILFKFLPEVLDVQVQKFRLGLKTFLIWHLIRAIKVLRQVMVLRGNTCELK